MNSIVLCPSVPPGVERHDFDQLLVLRYRFHRCSFKGHWIKLDKLSNVLSFTYSYFTFFFKLKRRVISNQHKWCLNREHSQSRYPTTISWPGEEIYWHSPHEQDVH